MWYYSGHLQSQNQDKKILWLSTHLFQNGINKGDKEPKIEMVHPGPLFRSSRYNGWIQKEVWISWKDQPRKFGGGRGLSLQNGWKGVSSLDRKLVGWGERLCHATAFSQAGDKTFGIELMLTPEKNPVIHGQNGISQKAKERDLLTLLFYPSLKNRRENLFAEQRNPCPGNELEWTMNLAPLNSGNTRWDGIGSATIDKGWSWCFIQIRHRDGKNRSLFERNHQFTPTNPSTSFEERISDWSPRRWKSSKSGAIYPSKWRVRVPGHQIELTLFPTVKNQELITKDRHEWLIGKEA